ncbi:chromatin assembly factor 1 subunit B, putative [Babesia bigemina]|uniref:Chromatin assembly factor 1 subunit B, putative n=1 Tax=Babesia bigemina TaxID=5866 RepID=A0A061DA79_BABBI|nr:chromatin assembly factor 1 subunit B, putative [Babesia bigemina]CDR97621.1 chromatin assembly factor 1 subunit B, putative [Babesia bigemina]|eukprot:XP_012769807.1 chromatin assembly factor 1 subunit B, putative [Babesia bigemina]
MPLVFLPQILWHSKDDKRCDRVYSLDFQPRPGRPQDGASRSFNLATGGADEFVHIWQVDINDNAPQYATDCNKSILAPENLKANSATGTPGVDNDVQPLTVKILARLVGHIGEVNAVRWNPNGVVLASGGEDRCIFLWAKAAKPNVLDASSQDYEEHYARFQYYRLSHVVNSISWCPDGRLIAVATEDGHVSLIDTYVEGNGKIRHFEGHTSFAQGVAMCPQNIMVASMGQDQTLRIWKRRNEKQWKNILVLKSAKDRSEFKESIGMESDDVRYSRSVFMNEELSTFFRRLDWSPDGRFLVTPAGIRHNALFKKEDEAESKNDSVYTLYIFHRKLINLGIPMVTHQSPTGPFVVVKFCPLDIAKIEKEKVNFFNKIFKTGSKNAKQKRIKSKKAVKDKEALKDASDAYMKLDSFTDLPSTANAGSDDAPYTDGVTRTAESQSQNLADELDGEVEDANGEDEPTGDVTCTPPSLVVAGIETDAGSVKEESVSDSQVTFMSSQLTDMAAKLQEAENSILTKLEADPEDSETYVAMKSEPIDVNEIDLTQSMTSVAIECEPAVDTQDEILDNDVASSGGLRSSKREIKKPQFYADTIGAPQELPRAPKPKVAKKEEEKEYDTDVEDDVVVPRLMFAAGTLDGSLCFYDTMEKKGPIAVLKNLHYCTITDIAWSPDGLVCATASSDGYITFVVFQKKEFY